MNSTFKVVFNKARGALMVVNEVTSSVQAKGTKTVVAAAVATMIAGVAGTAMAEEAAEPSEPAAKTTIVINNATTPNDLTKYAAMDFDGYVSSNASGHLGGAVLINGGQTVAFHDGVKFTNNTSEKSGGAIEVQAGTVTLKDAVITGNKADSWGGAIRMAGKSTVNLTVTKDTVYSGNKANANGKLDYPDMGDFVYMNGATNGQKTALNLKAEGDATLTVADSIASAGSNNEITTEGKVNVTGSMEAYTGDISVETGTFKLAGGFGSYDLWTTSNGAKKNSNAVAKLTVKEKAAAELGALTITRTSQDSNKKSIAGTELVVEQGGKLTVESITVTSQQYVNKDKKLDWTSHGWGKLENKGGEATVKDHITVEAGGKFEMTGDVTVGRINVAAKTDKLAAGILTGGDLTLNNGKSVNAGKLSVKNLELTAGSYLETTSNFNNTKDSFFEAESIYVGEGATLAFTDFNSVVPTASAAKEGEQKPVNNQVQLKSDLELDGGSLNGLKNLMVGDSEDKSSLLVADGNYAFDNLTLAEGQSQDKDVLTVEGGSLTVKALSTEAKVAQTLGTVTVTDKLTLKDKSKWTMTGGTLVFGKDLKVETAGKGEKIEVQNGDLQAWNSQIFGANDDKTVNYKTLSAAGRQIKTSNEGFLTILDKVEMTTAEVKDAAKAFQAGNLTFQNLTVKTTDNKQVDFDEAYGTALLAQSVAAPASGDKGAVALTISQGKTVGVGALTVDDKTKTIKADKGHLIVGGLGGNVIEGVAKVDSLTVKDLTLGKNEASQGIVNADELSAEKLTVVGSFEAENVSFTADSSIKEGSLFDVTTLTSARNNMDVAGTLVADVIDAAVNVGDSGVLVLAERQLAPATHALLAEDTTDAPKYVDQIQKKVTANQAGGLVTTNMQGEALFAAAAGDLFDDEKNVGLYVDHTIGVSDSGKLYVGNPKEKDGGSVAIAEDAVVVIDTKKFGAEDTVFDAKLYLAGDAPVILSGLTTNTSFILATETGSGDAKPGINLIDNNVFFKGDLNKAENGSLIVSTVFNDKVTDEEDLNNVIKTQLDGAHNQKNADVLAAIGDTSKKSGLVNEAGNALTEKGVQAVEEYLVAPLTAGALNLAYDATAQVNAVVENRALEKADGVWADVFYASNKDSERFGDFGYSADITGGTLGVDTTVSCGAKIGAAFTIGQGDADSEGTVHGYSTDADFYGISLYAGRNVADTNLRVSGNMSYLMFENDIKGSVAGASADESLDGKAFTAGLRADWTAYEGAFTVAPHAGLRYTFLDMDDYRDLEMGEMNIFEMPLGVKVSGAFEPAAGWTLQPSVDFTVVPQLGDKDVDTVLGAVDVIDNLYNTELGVEAATGNFSFGLSYKYGFGKEDRKNQSLNLNARYTF
ncbi:MAG: autotransporter domain-containing protein [Sutterella wadsworthensis]